MSRREPDPSELAFLRQPRGLARVATVDADGMPHVVPTGWRYDEESGDLLLTGRAVGSTRRVRHLATNALAAVVIDGVDEQEGWHPWAFIARGDARYDADERAIRLSPRAIISWGL